MEKSSKLAVGVFLKLPVPGRVKTRLAESVGADRAAALYRQILDRVLAETLAPLNPDEFSVFLLCDPFATLAEYREALGHYGFPFLEQQGNDLGERMAHAFSSLLVTHQAVCLIGSDCIDLLPAHLGDTAMALKSADVVLGPATDGGYYLIAAKKLHPELFKNIEWSSDQVFAATVKAAAKIGLTVKNLPPLSDIDTAEDLKRYPDLSSTL